MGIKSLTDLLEVVENEDIDKILLEYMLVLVGAKTTLEDIKKLVLNSSKDSISKEALLNIIDDEI